MTREQTLEEAKKCVCGQRPEDYGSPEESFSVIAQYWNIYLGNGHIQSISAKDVAIMMALLKIARLTTGRVAEDSFVDLAGYAACGAEISTKGSES